MKNSRDSYRSAPLTITLLLLAFPAFSQAAQFSPPFRWAVSAGSDLQDYGASVAVDAVGNCYFTGLFRASNGTFGTFILTNHFPPNGQLFVAKYDSLGNVLWARQADPDAKLAGAGIAVDKLGNSYTTGSFISSNATFGAFTLTNRSFNQSKVFVVKHDPVGNVLWARQASEGNSYGFAISAGGQSNVAVAGFFTSSPLTFGDFSLTNASKAGRGMFLASYDPDG